MTNIESNNIHTLCWWGYLRGGFFFLFFFLHTLSFLCDLVSPVRSFFFPPHIMCWNEVYLRLITGYCEIPRSNINTALNISAFLKWCSVLWVLRWLTSFPLICGTKTAGSLSLGRKRTKHCGNTEQLHPTTNTTTTTPAAARHCKP